MKLVVGGSTGYLGTEIIRQALETPSITSIVALARRETPLPEAATDASGKLKSVVCADFENYSREITAELKDADACIWTIAVTPRKAKEVSWEEVCKVSRDYAVAAIRSLAEIIPHGREVPFRFVYISGHFAIRNKDESHKILNDHGMTEMALMRGEAESLILKVAEQSHGVIQAAIAKPGFIAGPGRDPPPIPGLPHIQLRSISAALLQQVVDGFETDTLSNDKMAELGERLLG